MPFGVCSHCDRYYVLDQTPSRRWKCSLCRQPLRPTPREEALIHMRRVLERQLPAASVGSAVRRPWATRRIDVASKRPARKLILSVQALSSEHGEP